MSAAVLPAFQDANPCQRAHGCGVKMIGATAHYATEELDEGPSGTSRDRLLIQCLIHRSKTNKKDAKYEFVCSWLFFIWPSTAT